MNRRSLISLSAIAALGLAVLPGIAVGQQKSLKDTIVGSWSITSVIDQYENGKKSNPWGAVKGNVSFDGAGRFSQIIIGEAQPAMKTAEPRKPDALVVAYYGGYTVNEGTKTIAAKIDGASYSPRLGTPQTWTVAIDGDTVTLVGSPRKDQEGTFTPRLELKRAK
ncbi:MAG TPA: lipocalin-like domain-containing protein [Burkholderiales bacterium]|nr:lipocalin-like domain-containing protein [Burkholderiales bacterium]